MTIYLRARLGRGLAALGLLPLLGLTACNNDPQSGGLVVNYTFAPGVSCNQDAENVVDINVEVGEEGMAGSESVACDNNEGGQVVLTGITAGSYDLRVFGIDDQDVAVIDNLGGNDPLDRIEIIGGNNDKTIEVELGLIPARVEVRAFVHTGDSFPVPCMSDTISIKGLRVQAWDIASSDQLKSHDFDMCDFDDYLPVPDEERDINGREFDTVRLRPLDASGNPLGMQTEINLGAPLGAGRVLQLDVTCDDVAEACEATVLGGNPGTTTEDPTGEDPTGAEESTDGGSSGGSGTTGAGDTTG